MTETSTERGPAVPEAPGTTFEFGQAGTTPAPAASLGPLTAFTGTFTGHGFNTIFRPDSGSPTKLPKNPGFSDNLLELNLTAETLTFSPPLGSVPNRGEVQPDIFLNGVPYLQRINDITSGQPVGIHFEPGLWMCVPRTTDPKEGQTLVRMASIPHGTTICAEGTAVTTTGAPAIPSVSITPDIGAFPSQTASASNTARLPQDLSVAPFNAITQAMLTDPNTFLREAIAGQTILETTAISITTDPVEPLFGGGRVNMAFLNGDPRAVSPNAQVTTMSATFWIETVESTITVPAFTPGQKPVTVTPEATGANRLTPTFLIDPESSIAAPRTVRVPSTQIQYSQTVVLNFNGILWPHVSVATLVPSDPIPVSSATLAAS